MASNFFKLLTKAKITETPAPSSEKNPSDDHLAYTINKPSMACDPDRGLFDNHCSNSVCLSNDEENNDIVDTNSYKP